MINQMQFSLLENILTVLFLIAVVLWICYPDGLPPEHQCGDGTGRNRSGASDYFSGHGADRKSTRLNSSHRN